MYQLYIGNSLYAYNVFSTFKWALISALLSVVVWGTLKIVNVKFKLAKKKPGDRHDWLKNNEDDNNAFKIAFESQEPVIMFEYLDQRFDEFDNCWISHYSNYLREQDDTIK